MKTYGFYYPQLTFHKVAVTEKYLPATIEVLSSPFMIIKHGAVYKFNRAKGIEEEVYPEGFVVYYNKKVIATMNSFICWIFFVKLSNS